MERRNGRFVCQKCGRDYKHKGTLRSHLKNECGVAPQFHCPMCSYSFNLRGNLKTHVKRVHNSASTSKESSSEIDEEMKYVSNAEEVSDSNSRDDANGNHENKSKLK